MTFSPEPIAVLLGTLNLIFLLVGFHFLVSEILKIRRAGKFPAGTIEPWHASKGEIFSFVGIFLITLLFLPGFGVQIAKLLFPEVNLAENPIYAIGFYQPIALAFLWNSCVGKNIGWRAEIPIPVLTISNAWNLPNAKPVLSRLSVFSGENVWQFFGLMLLAVSAAMALSLCVPLVFPSLEKAWAQNQILIDNLRTLEHSWILILVVPTLVIFTPILEEILFRAGIYRLLRCKMSGIPAALLTGFCFAIMHDSLAGILPLAILSCALCYAYERTGKLAVPIILHGLFNLNSFLQTYFTPEI